MKHKKSLLVLVSSLFCLGIIGCGQSPAPGPSPSPIGDDLGPAPTYSEDSIQIHYARVDRKFKSWALWLWEYPTGEGVEYAFNGSDNYGAIASYPLSKWSSSVTSNGIGFIVKSAGSWNKKDPDGDRIMDFSKLNKDSKGVYHIYLQSGDKNIYNNPDLEVLDEITKASFENYKRIAVETNTNIVSYKVYENGNVIGEQTLNNPTNGFRFSFPGETKASLEKSYKVEVKFQESKKTLSTNVSVRSLYKTADFKSEYTYDGQLGAIYSKESTTFKVWSPVATAIKVRLYNSGTPKSVSASGDDTIKGEYPMVRGEKGVYSVTVNGDLEGVYYTLIVTSGKYTNKEIVDPYAFSGGVNGLRGMIVDFSKTNPEGFEMISPFPYDRKELTVYETHIADITSSSTWTKDSATRKLEKTFKGAATSGTTYTENGVTVKTGLDHIKELGVNAVQLIPIFDQANDEIHMTFNWGYNPSNYNMLEGGYSTNPYNGYTRIVEFKELVKAYHDAGINIIMDVVYNHVNGVVGSNFDVLMPDYYFRYNADGSLSNGSGCGNETASEMPMFQKFMIDSVCFWAKEYKLGGFRFDLMGLHDLSTMEKLTNALKQINPNIVVYGEPWQGGTSPLSEADSAKQINAAKYKGYGAFNDQMRDSLIKGGLNGATATGWITNNKTATGTGDLNKIAAGIKGSTKTDSAEINDPNKTVNYVTCHDNYTLYDRIKAAGIKDEAIVKKMAMLANSVVFTSNGTTFMLAGEEFLRTKGGNNNSYNASYKVNELDYALKVKNLDMFENYKKLIKLKQEVSGLHLSSGENNTLVIDTSLKNVIKYQITDKTTGRTYMIIHANGYNGGSLPTVDLSGYTLYLDTVNGTKTLSASTKIESYETLIAYK